MVTTTDSESAATMWRAIGCLVALGMLAWIALPRKQETWRWVLYWAFLLFAAAVLYLTVVRIDIRF